MGLQSHKVGSSEFRRIKILWVHCPVILETSTPEISRVQNSMNQKNRRIKILKS